MTRFVFGALAIATAVSVLALTRACHLPLLRAPDEGYAPVEQVETPPVPKESLPQPERKEVATTRVGDDGSAAVRVTLLEARSGQPLRGREIVVRSGHVTIRRGDTDLQGRVVFDELPFGKYVVSAARRRTKTLELNDATLYEVELSLDARREVHGFVSDPDGRPIPLADIVRLSRPTADSARAPRSVGQADSNGRFTVRDLVRSDQIFARASGYWPSQRVSAGGAWSDGINLVCQTLSPTPLVVRVYDDLGNPIPDAAVVLNVERTEVRDGIMEPVGQKLRTDVHGIGRFADRPGGPAFVEVDGGEDYIKARRNIAGEEHVVDVRLERTIRVVGRVLLRDGAACEDAEVQLIRSPEIELGSARSGPGGAYVLAGLPRPREPRTRSLNPVLDRFLRKNATRFTVQARHPTHGTGRIEFDCEDHETNRFEVEDIVLGSTPTTIGLTNEEGLPLSEWHCKLERVDGASFAKIRKLDGTGKATFHLFPGPYSIACYHEGYPNALKVIVAPSVQLACGDQRIFEVDVPTGRVIGRVVGEPDGFIHLQSKATQSVVTAKLAGDGSWEIGRVPAGDYSVFFRRETERDVDSPKAIVVRDGLNDVGVLDAR